MSAPVQQPRRSAKGFANWVTQVGLLLTLTRSPVGAQSPPTPPERISNNPPSPNLRDLALPSLDPDAPKLPTRFPPRGPIAPPPIPLGPTQVEPMVPSEAEGSRPAESGRIPYVQEETPGLPLPGREEADQIPSEGVLELDEILRSVDSFFPLLLSVEQDRLLADADIVSALGAFDLNLRGHGVSNALGFYQYNRSNLGLEQQFRTGGIKTFAGHRWGVGDFPTWYGNYQTNDGGELYAGAKLPLLRDRTIDKYRADLAKANIERLSAEPTIQKARIEFLRAASLAYWDWLAAGQAYSVAQSLLLIAEERDVALQKRIDAGLTKPIERTDNQRLIVGRQAKLVAAQRKFQQAAIKLSLFLRGGDGLPVLPPARRLPLSFPPAEPTERQRLPEDIDIALARRPEIRKLQLLRQKTEVNLSLARNDFLPSLDAAVLSSQDVGGPTPKRDKSDYQFEAGLYLEVPLQRRYARGRIDNAQALLTRIMLEERYARDKVVADVQDAVTAMEAAYRQIGQARESLELNRIMEQAERRNLFLGNSNILFVNLRETATVDAALLEVEALVVYFQAVADYRAALALALDPPLAATGAASAAPSAPEALDLTPTPPPGSPSPSPPRAPRK